MEHEDEKNQEKESKELLIEKHVSTEQSKNIREVRKSDVLKVIIGGEGGGIPNYCISELVSGM